MTDIEKAILSAEYASKEFEGAAQELSMHDEEGVQERRVEMYQNYASSHRQLAEWLKELIHLRNVTEYLRDTVDSFEFMGSMHYNEDIIKYAEEELRVDMRGVNDADTD